MNKHEHKTEKERGRTKEHTDAHCTIFRPSARSL